MLPLLEALHKAHDWRAMVPISAKTGDGVDRLVGELAGCCPTASGCFPRRC